MTTYSTKNSEYIVEKVGERDAIRCLQGPTEGKPYAILGSINPEEHKIEWVNLSYIELCYVDWVPFSKENFREFTDEHVKKGSRIVSILIDESTNELSWGKQGDLMLTGLVKEIRE